MNGIVNNIVTGEYISRFAYYIRPKLSTYSCILGSKISTSNNYNSIMSTDLC